MKIALRVLAALAALIALGIGAAATAANADGPKTDKRVVSAIKAQPWKVLEVGDREYRVASVRCFLTQFGYYNDCDPEADLGDLFEQDMVLPVKRYQGAKGIEPTGKIDGPTWDAISADHGIARAGDGRTHLVKGLQYALKVLQEPDLVVDGAFGSATKEAVTDFQARKHIDADGEVGPITFRAMFAQGAEARGTPR